MYTWYFFFFPKQAVSLRHKLVWPFLAKQKVLGKVYRLCPVVLLSICVQTCILICRFQSRRNIQNFHRFTGKENYNEWTIIVWGTYMSGYKCQNPWKPWYLPGFLKIWKYLNCPRGNKTKTMSFFFRFDYPSAIIFVRMRLISVWIINTVDKARSVINMNIIIYELAML